MAFKKITSLIRRHGFKHAVLKILKHPLKIYSNKSKEKNIFQNNSIEDRFTAIYDLNYWGSKESVSGGGSTLRYTKNLREKLPGLFHKYSTNLIFDAPCGDLNWMKVLLAENNFRYIGGDIVKDIIVSHNLNFTNERTNFIHIDLTKDKFPHADLMICRDCIFHLSYEDTELVLNNFINSGIPLLLTTTHKNIIGFKNKDIKTGFFRLIDLFSPPYCFNSEPLERIDDWMLPEPEREMCLWSRDQIKVALNDFKNRKQGS